jgi:type II secretory pathway pseudopilin PulG
MIEIALCLAIIGFALVSILLVLPSGMTTQRDTRQETIIGQDASMLLEAIRNGERGVDDLTNYVYAITNTYQGYNQYGKTMSPVYTASYTYTEAFINGVAQPAMHLTNGLRIIGLLSTPEFTSSGAGSPPPPVVGGVPLVNTFGNYFTSNHVVAYVRSVSGLAAEKPPQNNSIMQGNTFSYRVLCVNAPLATDTNVLMNTNAAVGAYTWQLAESLRELRLTFMWPQLPSGNVGPYRQTFRASVGGQLVVTNYGNYFQSIWPLYFYQSQSFTTNLP